MSNQDDIIKSVTIPDYVAIERENQRLARSKAHRERIETEMSLLGNFDPGLVRELLRQFDEHVALYGSMPQAQRDIMHAVCKSECGCYVVSIENTDTVEHAKALEQLGLLTSSVNAAKRKRTYRLATAGYHFISANGF